MIQSETVEIEQRNLLVQRIAGSDLFQKSPRLRDFLLYAAECTLENRLSDVREQVIAERVFGRRPEFQGAQDSIVRAEARNLRKRLETYFTTEGKDEPLIVTMPKGGYSLAFETRFTGDEAGDLASPSGDELAATPPLLPSPAELTHEPTHEPAPQRVYIPPNYRRATLFLSFVSVTALSLAFYWYFANASLREQLHLTKPALPFSALFAHDMDTLIVTSDTGLLQISSLAHRPISLDDYIARMYPNVPNIDPPDLIRNWNIYEFTDGREMAIAGLIQRDYIQFAQRISLRSGHEVQLEDFKEKNVILIGSPISNPWAQLYEDKLNFRCALERDGRIVFRNSSSRPGELTQYPGEDDIQHNRTYASLVFLPKNADTSSTLLIAGTTAQATEEAGEFVTDKARLHQVLRSMGIDPDGPPRFFEILIRTNTFVGGAILPEVVASRAKPL